MKTARLRFSRRAATRLREIANASELKGREDMDTSVFSLAAESAEKGEPLDVGFDTKDELDQYIAGFRLWGVEEPTIDELILT